MTSIDLEASRTIDYDFMRKIRSLFPIFILTFILVSCDQGDEETGSRPHEGKWRAVSATMAGTPYDKSVVDSIFLKLAGDRYETEVGGQPDMGTSVIDWTVVPHRIVITGVEGPNAGRTYLAIVEFTGSGEMRICYDLRGETYPERFESTEGNGYYLAVYGKAD